MNLESQGLGRWPERLEKFVELGVRADIEVTEQGGCKGRPVDDLLYLSKV